MVVVDSQDNLAVWIPVVAVAVDIHTDVEDIPW